MVEEESMHHPRDSIVTESMSGEEDGKYGPVETLVSCLKDVEECTKVVETMSSRKFNNEQCNYLVDKLKAVFQIANSYLESRGIMRQTRGRHHLPTSNVDNAQYLGTRSHMDSRQRVEVFKLLVAVAEKIESFVRGCCDDAWIQAAILLTNVSEYVSSLGFDLELCRAAFCKECAANECLTSDEVGDIYKAEVRSVEVKASVDVAILRAKLVKVLEQNTPSGDEWKLACYLDRRIAENQSDSAIPTTPTTITKPTTTIFGRVRSSVTGKISRLIYRKPAFLFGSGTSEKVEKLGQGASAQVFKASWCGMPVAKKVFPGAVNSEFKKEVEVLENKTLSHPNITSMFYSTTDKGTCSIFMELMDGDLCALMDDESETMDGESETMDGESETMDGESETMDGESEAMDSESPLFTFLEGVDLMLQLGEGVNYLHNKGIVHMDLKSSNVLVRGSKAKDSKSRYLHAKVTDFGISKTKAQSISYSDQQYNLGSNRYMPPEFIKSDADVKESSSKDEKVPKYPKRSDVFSFAMLCSEILTGKLPFSEVGAVDAKRKIKAGERPVLPDDCPLKLKSLIEKCWNHNPEQRPSFDSICSELRHLKYLLMTDIVTFDACNYKGGFFTYNTDFLVDRPVAKSLENPYTRMMDRVRHRLDPCATDASSNIDCDVPTPEVLVELLIRSDVLIQIALFQLLLEERFAVPIVVPYNEDFNDFRHLLEALNFVHVKVVNQEILPIAENTSLPRVVFVSNRQTVAQRESADMACEVMNCEFLSKEIRRGGPTIVELGVGFLKSSTSQSSKHVPCLVFCVSGDHNKLGMTLEKIADVVIIEIDPGTEPSLSSFPSWIRRTGSHIETLFWSIDSSRRRYDRETCHVSGKFKDISQLMIRHVLGTNKFQGNGGEAMSLAACFHSISPLHRLSPVSNTETFEVDFSIVRKSLSLQKLYTEEAEHYFLSLRERWSSADHKKEMQNCQEARKHRSGDVQKLPILQLFVQLLSEKKEAKRCLNILHLQIVIDQKLRTQLQIASKRVVDAFEKTQDDPRDQNLKDSYKHAMNEHVSQMLGLEHLWRELSHIFVADHEKQSHLPKLAARHLLDGFPLEILDGDATNFYKEWVDTVLIELDHELQTLLKHKPKVFVLSVIGLQSSGKSTLLNVMFGTKLKTSAGMCTRGVFLQLVKSEWPTFDYVLILDTMGLRAPEYFGREDSAVQDNLLATFAVLPADACIVMVANEEDNGLKEVLPMVMLAFKGSAVAELGGGRIQSKLFFVYRGVDVNDVHKLGRNQRKLKVDLNNAADAVARLPKASSAVANNKVHGTNDTLDVEAVGPLSMFRINCEDEKLSDVKLFGNLKKGTRPPGDTPIWEFGSKVEELREYINERVLDEGRWSAHELVEWKDYLGMVWHSISEADFELSFLNHLDHTNYQDLQTRMATSRQNVGRKWQDEFDQVLTTGLEVDGELDPDVFNSLWKALKLKVKCEVDNEDKVVESTLDLRQFQKWKLAEIERWQIDRVANEKHWEDKLRDCVDSTLRFDLLVKGYITKIQKKISERDWNSWENIESPKREKEMEEDFKELFESILADAKKKYPPLAETVKGRIQKIYDESIVGRKFRQVSADYRSQISWQEYVKSYFSDSGRSSKAAELCHQFLIPPVRNKLQNVKQYSRHVVEDIMQLTSDLVVSQSKQVQGDMHKLVKDFLVEELSEVQEEWDLHHNVARRLETHRDYLRQSFLNHANKVGGTKMLSMALCDLLGPSQLLNAYKAQIARSASNNLQSGGEWVCNWKIMRAHLDLHLIELIKAKEIEKVIDFVQDGAQHYKNVVNKFIEQEIKDLLDDTNDWKLFTSSICYAMEVGAVEAKTSNSTPSSSKPLIFLQSIIKSLGKMSQALARGVSITVSKEACLKYSDDIDFDKIRDDVSASVNNVQLNMTNSMIKEVIELVRNRLISSNTVSARARCDVMCPHCKLTCFKAMHHDGKHDTLHQPQGLSGTYYIRSKELTPRSCSRSVELNETFYFTGDRENPDTYTPYSKWTEIYSEWILPSQELGTVEVREYIFAHFQEELLKRGNGKSKKCVKIPVEFQQHSLPTLQLNLENTIRSVASVADQEEEQQPLGVGVGVNTVSV